MTHRLALTLSLGIAACGWLAVAQPVAEGARAAAAEQTQAAAPAQADQGAARGGGRGAARRKRVLAWADTRNGQAQHESVVARAGGHRAARLRVGHVGHVHPHRLAHHLEERRRRPTARPPAAARA